MSYFSIIVLSPYCDLLPPRHPIDPLVLVSSSSSFLYFLTSLSLARSISKTVCLSFLFCFLKFISHSMADMEKRFVVVMLKFMQNKNHYYGTQLIWKSRFMTKVSGNTG